MTLYPNVTHEAGLKALKDVLDSRENKPKSVKELIKMTYFVLENNYFEFYGIFKQQIPGFVIGTKFAPTYAYIFMDNLETDFFNMEEYLPLVWCRYIGDIFFIWVHGEKKLKLFLDGL